MYLLIVLDNGKVADVVCCANGTDSSHVLRDGEGYTVINIGSIRAEPRDWLNPKMNKPMHKHGEVELTEEKDEEIE